MYNLFLLASLKYRISASVDDFNLRLKALAELLVAHLPVVILIKLQHPLIDLINLDEMKLKIKHCRKKINKT